ncbi:MULTISPECIES: S-adenosyl-l-methionine hydroxide adenosyltransferase family protein [unclassified Lentimicrobium]|uniref:SAM hydrolase/SAM-dependent halogenase family protein n=1 Tax=unclassified Lentimicrobium TaxID=2677434 RepID=UPI001555AC4D|nr:MULTISPECIES: SAM-dependent chlorinase/fluorinase [unclassified Lentimicrobium]NPD46248.1 SAM-dependent chlorinase/fluorinase [Lentimicrobium sp. S6]NPD83984.1 SAM-dependent chlorinase/fluorinase [Lentimicrobium sp. L6]
MPIITLTTDWGIKDHYLASVKGAILKYIPQAQTVDISHEIAPFDLNEASYILRNTWDNFPDGTIHIVGVNSEASLEHPHVLIKHKGHYFIGADNGIFSLMFDEIPEEIYEVDIIQTSNKYTFSTKDTFVQAALHVVKGEPLAELGDRLPELTNRMAFQPVTETGVIKGKVIYIDRYENVVTNISETLFQELVQSKPFNILLRAGKYKINKIRSSYSDVGEGELVALFGSDNLLEIAQNRGRAAGLLGLQVDDVVRIEIGE